MLLVAVGCADHASESGPEVTPQPRAGIEVELGLPDGNHGIVGPATGRVRTDEGELVTDFEFASAWIIPDGFNYAESPATSTGAAPTVAVVLPEPGTYRFELDSFVVSGSPCGTCERVMAGGEIEAQVKDGTVVELPAGELQAVS